MLWLSSPLLFAWSLAVPAVLGSIIETNILNTTKLVCSTRYASTSLSGQVPTKTATEYLEDGQIMILTTTITPVATFTPSTLTRETTEFITNTTWLVGHATRGTWDSINTILATSTVWFHETVTETKVYTVRGTRQSISWVPAPTGFKPIRDTRSGLRELAWQNPGPALPRKVKRDLPDASTSSSSTTSKVSTRCRRPLASKFPAAVECRDQTHFTTTETIIVSTKATSTTTVRAPTSWNTTTVYGGITSTVLDSSDLPKATQQAANRKRAWNDFFGHHSNPEPASSPSGADADADAEAQSPDKDLDLEAAARSYIAEHDADSTLPTQAAGGAGAVAPKKAANGKGIWFSTIDLEDLTATATATTTTPKNGIQTRTINLTKTPFTTIATHTVTSMRTSTHRDVYTRTATSYAACMTSNQLAVDFKSQRLNGVAVGVRGRQREVVVRGLDRAEGGGAYACCLLCIGARPGRLEEEEEEGVEVEESGSGGGVEGKCAFSLYHLQGGSRRGMCILYMVDEPEFEVQEAQSRASTSELGLEAEEGSVVAKRGVINTSTSSSSSARSAAKGAEEEEAARQSQQQQEEAQAESEILGQKNKQQSQDLKLQAQKQRQQEVRQRDNMGLLTFRRRNGEGVLVGSNGFYGFLGDGDLIYP